MTADKGREPLCMKISHPIETLQNAFIAVLPEEPSIMCRPSLTATQHLGTSLLTFVALLCFSAAAAAPPRLAPSAPLQTQWVGTWAAAPFGGDPWHEIPTLVSSTVRQIVHTSIAGKALRIHFTNEFGTQPLRIAAASIAFSSGESAIQPGSLHAVTFSGKPSILIPPGAEVLSDTVDFPTQAFADLTISLFVPLQQISNVSAHSSARQINLIQIGNEVSALRLTTPVTTHSWYLHRRLSGSRAANRVVVPLRL